MFGYSGAIFTIRGIVWGVLLYFIFIELHSIPLLAALGLLIVMVERLEMLVITLVFANRKSLMAIILKKEDEDER